jgi:uncharacterized protein YbjT (DUF2867 family)
LLSFAKENGVHHITFLSSHGVSYLPGSLFATHHGFYEDAILEAGLNYTFLRPGPFASNTRIYFIPFIQAQPEYGGGEGDEGKGRRLRLPLPYPNTQIAPIADEDIAAVALVALTTDTLLNQVVDLCGPQLLSPGQQMEAINRLRQREGKREVEVVKVSEEEWPASVAGAIPEMIAGQFALWWKTCDVVPEQEGNTSEKITGIPSQSFEEWLELNKEPFLEF